MAFNLFRRMSPEYALNETYADIKDDGIVGLKKHLTANALKAIESVESVADLSSLVIGSNPTNLLIGKMAEFEYEVIDVLKGKETAHLSSRAAGRSRSIRRTTRRVSCGLSS